MSSRFPLDREAVAAADAAILPKNGGKPLTMERQDAPLRREWLNHYDEELAKKKAQPVDKQDKHNKQDNRGKPSKKTADTDPAKIVHPCPLKIKRKNIIFIGSELSYDSFWLKMMFMAPGVSCGSGTLIRQADFTTIAYVNKDYTFFERLPLDALRNKFGHKIVQLTSSQDVIAVLNDLPVLDEGGCKVQTKLQDVVFFSHGLPSKIKLNYDGHFDVDLSLDNFSDIRADAFIEDGKLYSYACRTGNNSVRTWFMHPGLADAPNSLAQKLADRLNVSVHAFMVRSNYRNVLRDRAASSAIAATLTARRVGHEMERIEISEEHEALPHPGLADGFFDGASDEGTNCFALWRKKGARVMPEGGDTPTGIPQYMIEFKPGVFPSW